MYVLRDYPSWPKSLVNWTCCSMSAAQTDGRVVLSDFIKSYLVTGSGSSNYGYVSYVAVIGKAAGSPGEHGMSLFGTVCAGSFGSGPTTRLKWVATWRARMHYINALRTSVSISLPEYISVFYASYIQSSYVSVLGVSPTWMANICLRACTSGKGM